MQDSKIPDTVDPQNIFSYSAQYSPPAHIYIKRNTIKMECTYLMSGDKSLPLYDGQEATRYNIPETGIRTDAAAGILRPVAYGRSDNDA